MATLVGDLVDLDPFEPCETVNLPVDLDLDPLDDPTNVRRPTRISSVTAVFDVAVASQPIVSSKSRVNRDT